MEEIPPLRLFTRRMLNDTRCFHRLHRHLIRPGPQMNSFHLLAINASPDSLTFRKYHKTTMVNLGIVGARAWQFFVLVDNVFSEDF
jgi:hypothetical protein